ncbi:winged helix-turn-helix transcriptional regulator [Sphingomonas qomolangmaensis]|uniref:Winged helix-turn-helix transcriptional regulator n=1 Tax=Sphingomonas qomolangmaensis TaxID=2918765 RepID=A0ABY5L954_9SPHN|nr:winged helix-turn-helix transcriptional regulator [Sphingomonas qomolangmaensis]UUL82098.1 winged helix-turn-helix transcriptional regulator [Sphingomonas qomolangmaensis]
MKLSKVTEVPEIATKRWYDDACGTALALELVGERWSLLIVRELMFGARRFSELRAGLPGISANILTQRLTGLVAARIVQREQLPPPANAQVYGLTPWGYEAERAIQALGRWAARSPDHDPTLPLSAASIMLSFRTMYGGGFTGRIGFAFGPDRFVADVTPDAIPIVRDDPARAAAVFTTDPMTLAGIVYGARPIADAEAAGALTLTGDRALAEAFVGCFTLPPKAG